MEIQAWRRVHGWNVVCQVDAVNRDDEWRLSTWLVSNPTGIVRSPITVRHLHAAQAQADDLARTTFDHTCDVETCDIWLPIDWEPLT